MRALFLVGIFALVPLVTEAQHGMRRQHHLGNTGYSGGPCIRIEPKPAPVTTKPSPAPARASAVYRKPPRYNPILAPRGPVVGHAPRVIHQPRYQQSRQYAPHVRQHPRVQPAARRLTGIQLTARNPAPRHYTAYQPRNRAPPINYTGHQQLPPGFNTPGWSDRNEPVDHPHFDIDILPGTNIQVETGPLAARMKRQYGGRRMYAPAPCQAAPKCASRLDIDGEHAMQDANLYTCNLPSLACVCSIAK